MALRSYACGKLKSDSFHLRIARPGCEFNGHIGRYSEEIDRLLPGLFDHSAILYSDAQSMEANVGSEVCNVREIPALEFKVKPKFLEGCGESSSFLTMCWQSHIKSIFMGPGVTLIHIVTIRKRALLGHSWLGLVTPRALALLTPQAILTVGHSGMGTTR